MLGLLAGRLLWWDGTLRYVGTCLAVKKPLAAQRLHEGLFVARVDWHAYSRLRSIRKVRPPLS